MNQVVKLLSYLRRRDIQLRVAEGRLHFNAPKGALTPELREMLKEHKEDLIAFLKEANAASTEIALVALAAEERNYALSFAQQRLWFIMQMERASTAYNIPRSLLLKGALDTARLERCFQHIIARHEILRTSFPSQKGKVLQKIAPYRPMPVPMVDLSGRQDVHSEACALHLAEREAARIFDLSRDALLRVVLVRLAPDTHHLLVTMHHIISDGWSARIMIEELRALYEAEKELETRLPPLAIQYADFSQWQQRWLQGEVLENQLDYWVQQLAHPSSMLILPTDRPYRPIQSFSGDRMPLSIEAKATTQLRQLAQNQGATLFMVLESLFAILLSRYSGQEDIIIGTPVANRNRVEIEPLIGFFVNTLALRNDLSGNPSFIEFLGRTQQTIMSALAHQDVPLEQVLERLEIPRTLSFNAPFQVVFALQNLAVGRQQWGPLEISALPVANVTAKFDLTLAFSETAGGLAGSLEYNSDLFQRSTISEMTEGLLKLVDEILAQPEASLLQLGACSPRALETHHPGAFQHKGFLVKPQQVEERLKSYPGVAEALVGSIEDRDGQPFLAAWVRPKFEADLDLAELMQHLEKELPDFMMPQGIGSVVDLDKDARHQLNRLPLPATRQSGQARESASGPVAEMVAQIWSEVLERPQVRATDNFFDLGGQSLGATRVIALINEAFDLDFPLKQLFLAPILSQFSARVEHHLRARSGEVLPSIEPTPADHDAPLSFAQYRLWFLSKMAGGTRAYNIPVSLLLRGDFSGLALVRALSAVMLRHEALRTVIIQQGDNVYQHIQSAPQLKPVLVDLGGLSKTQREQSIAQIAAAEALHDFQLSQGPLVRLTLLRSAAREHVVLLNVHHIVADGVSAGILVKELSVHYRAFLLGSPASLPPLSIQYRDYATWQRRYLDGAYLAAQRAFWQGRLANAPELLDLPCDHARPALQTYHGDTITFQIGPAMVAALDRFARANRATLFMTLLAGFQAFLARYSGQDDITVGSPTANRGQRQVEALIGFFVNTLVFRAQLQRRSSFESLLQQVRADALDAYVHQDIPFEQVVEALQPQRDPRRTPLFQAMFSLTNLPPEGLALPGLSLEPLPLKRTIAKYDLSLIVSESADRLVAIFEYNTDLFNRSTVEDMSRHFLTFMGAALVQPQVPLLELALLDAEEHRRLCQQWSQSYTLDQPPARDFVDILRDVARRTPDAIAVSDSDASLTFAELADKASRLAGFLGEAGVIADTAVGLCCGRHCDMVLGITAIMMAGGAYVPLDPANTAERQQTLIEQVGLSLILTQAVDETAMAGCRRIALDDRRVYDRAPIATRSWAHCPGRMAYIIFTSGTTGVPKGVVVSHHALSENLAGWQSSYQLALHRCHLQMAQFTFDVFSADLVRALANGARLYLCPKELLTDPVRLYRLMRDERVDFAEFVPAVIRELMDYLDQHREKLHFLRTLIVGSDSWNVGEYRRLTALCGPDTRVINGYGTTETTVDNTVYSETAPAYPDGMTTPIGVTHPNTGAYLFNQALVVTPVGVFGELYLGGEVAARGYFGRPGLTAERFLPDPISPLPGARMYRTGDAARESRSGVLAFLGRTDHQVKLRGYRIEPSEISAVLEQHALVRMAFTMLCEDRPGHPQLVSYVQLQADSLPDGITTIRDHARRHLPSYMVPAALLVVEQFPLNANGKLDRAALPAPELEEDSRDFRAPGTETEQALARIWQEVLGLDRVACDDHFFELGGHSLLATRVLSRVTRDFAVELSPSDFFATPILAQMSQRIDQLRGSEAVPPMSRPVPVPRDRDMPLSFAQQRLWFLEQMGHSGAAYNMPFALRLEGRLCSKALSAAIDAVLERHESLRTLFPVVEGKPVQQIRMFQSIQLPVIDLAAMDATSALQTFQDLIEADAAKPFILDRGPLLRTSLVKLAKEDHGLLVNMHHIVSDGWSINVFITELTGFYRSHVTGGSYDLMPLSIQYADYAHYQRNWFTQEQQEQEKQFWKTYLANAPALLNLPTDRPRPTVKSFQGASINFLVHASLTSHINRFAAKSGSTLFMVLQSFFSALLARYSGQTDIVVGTAEANRHLPEVEPLIGFFINTLALRFDLSKKTSLNELTTRVRANTLACFDHSQMPFEQVVELVQPERNTAHTPLFQVMLVVQNTPAEPIQLPGLRLLPLTSVTRTAKFDLNLAVLEKDRQLNCVLNYNTDLFEAATVQRMAHHLCRLMELGLDQPQLNLMELSLHSEDERQFLVEICNQTTRPFPQDALLHELFQAQAERVPDKIALACDNQCLTYRELLERADHLAVILRQRGIRAESTVGLCMVPSLDLIVGILGILMAGGTYVPLDQSYPLERLEVIIEDATPTLILVKKGFGLTVPVATLEIDNLPAVLVHARSAQPLDPAMPAYIMYTSGSTGRPKGVVVTHRNVVRLVCECDYVTITPEDRFLQAASTAFDASTLEIWGSLLHGAHLEILPTHQLPELPRLLVELKISILWLTAQLFHAIVDDHLDSLAEVHQLLVGGDTVSLAHVRKVQQRHPHLRLINGYGPTEGTTFTSCCDLNREGIFADGLSIGRPIVQTDVYVMDSYMKLAPIGVFGELWIGGEGLARCYLRQPARTAEKFAPHPFKWGKRLYRSGDLVRVLANGLLAFAGRIDRQIKIRGFRIELGEVEHALRSHPQVKDAVVRVDEDGPEKQLIAYVVPQTEVDAQVLGGFLGTKLPKYMVPSAFLILERFPLTPNGKLDARALPRFERTDEETYLPPTTPTETLVAEAWAELLGLEKVGMAANFFEMGGHSLMATRAIARLQKQLDLAIPIASLFQNPTAAAFARYLDLALWTSRAQTGETHADEDLEEGDL